MSTRRIDPEALEAEIRTPQTARAVAKALVKSDPRSAEATAAQQDDDYRRALAQARVAITTIIEQVRAETR